MFEFQHSRRDIILVLSSITLVLFLFRIRKIVFPKLFSGVNTEEQENSLYYDGISTFPVGATFVIRFLWIFLGMAALIYMDFFRTRDNQEEYAPILHPSVGNSYVVLSGIIVHLLLFWIKETFLAITWISSTTTAVGVGISLIGMSILSGLIFWKFTSLTSSTILVLTYIAFDIRDGRAFWKRHRPGSYFSKKRNEPDYFNSMVAVVVFFGAMIISLCLGYAVGSGKDNALNPLYYPSSVNFPQTPYAPNSLCNEKWDRFTLIDFTTMSGTAYAANLSLATSFVHHNPNLLDARVHQGNFESTVGNRILEFRFDDSPNISIVSVRGTTNMEDVLTDILLWSTPAVLQGSSYFGTFMSFWPQEVTARLVALVSNYIAFSNFLVFKPAEILVSDLIAQNRTVLITGHSLGGGIAGIVGSRLGIPSVGISSPGLGLSVVSFGLSLKNITRWTSNLIPFNDPGIVNSFIFSLFLIPFSF